MLVEFPFIWLNNLKFMGCRILFLMRNIYFVKPWTSLPGMATSLPFPSPFKKNLFHRSKLNWAYSGVMIVTLVTMNLVTTFQYS
jgi:hypothetical protein